MVRSRPSDRRRVRLALVAAFVAAVAPTRAAALPAVLVGAAPFKIRNHRSHLVVVQDGPRTTMNLQLDVLGVPMDLAIVVPIHGDVDPDSLQTLDRRLFDRLDRLSAPRLVQVWEQDPCASETRPKAAGEPVLEGALPSPPAPFAAPRDERPATIIKGEFDFAALGRIGAGELEVWLRERGYPLTDAHTAALADHFAAGASFVVARVDRRQVHFDARGNAVLSPFRVAFTAADDWRIPLRAGLGHAIGVQDVVIHTIAPHAADLDPPAAPMPAGFALQPAATDRFAAVYAAMFVAAHAASGAAPLREHTAPLPIDALASAELAALGIDLHVPPGLIDRGRGPLVLTRLHLRYAPADLPADPMLIPLHGPPGPSTGTAPSTDLRADYFVRHPWTGPVACDAPQRGVWGPPPDSVVPEDAAPRWVRAMAPAGPVADLAALLAEDVPALGLSATPAGCACTVDRTPPPSLALAMWVALAPRRRRPPRSPA